MYFKIKKVTFPNEKSQYFIQYIQDLIEDGLKSYIIALRGVNSGHPPKITIYITIKILNLLFKIDDNYMTPYLNKIQDVAEIFIIIFKQKNVRGKNIEESQDLIGTKCKW